VERFRVDGYPRPAAAGRARGPAHQRRPARLGGPAHRRGLGGDAAAGRPERLQKYVSQLRRYIADRHSAAENRPETAVRQLSEAEALWQGAALSDVPERPTVGLERSRLDQARLSAVEARLDAQLRIGRHEEMVDELVQLVAQNPLRERLRAQLMLCLYRCGRRADALKTYRRGRRALIEELGLAGKRLLVVLDNTTGPDQVRQLVPGNPACVTLVTSRDRMDGLVARDGAARIRLDVLDSGEATALMSRLLGPGRAAESEALPALAALCGNLPLALRVAAADVAAHPAWTVAEYSARLRGDQLGTLPATGDPHTAVRSAIDLSYTALTAAARRLLRLLRLLGLVPRPDVTERAAAALAGTDAATAAGLIDRLAAAHLIEEHAAGRYTFHDLQHRVLLGPAAHRVR
jgi:hypothetical protein